MRKTLLMAGLLTACVAASADDGSRLWLRYDTLAQARVIGMEQSVAARELRQFYRGQSITLQIDAALGRR